MDEDEKQGEVDTITTTAALRKAVSKKKKSKMKECQFGIKLY